MKIGIIQLTRASGMTDLSYGYAKGMIESDKEVEIIGFLHYSNPFLSKWHDLGIKTYVFDTYSSNAFSILYSLYIAKKYRQVVDSIIKEKLDLLFEISESLWSKAVFQEVKDYCMQARIIHDPNPHSDRWQKLVQIQRFVFRFTPLIEIAISDSSYLDLQKTSKSLYIIKSKQGAYFLGANDGQHQDSETIAEKHHQFLFFGRIESYKGLPILVSAFVKAKQYDSKIELEIVGRGPVSQEVFKKITENGITFNNTWVSDEELNRIISRNGVIVLPYTSCTQSGPGIVAVARGYPCIATNVGAFPEQIRHDYNGIIIEPANVDSLVSAILKIASSKEIAERYSKNATLLAENDYAWHNICQELVGAFESILQKENEILSKKSS